jgi:hypothetical protein
MPKHYTDNAKGKLFVTFFARRRVQKMRHGVFIPKFDEEPISSE